MRGVLGMGLALAVVGCGGGGGGGADTGTDAAVVPPPALVEARPESGVPDMVIELLFSEPMDLASLQAAVLVTDSAGAIHEASVTGDGAAFAVTPIGAWGEGETHTLTIGVDARSSAGVPLAAPAVHTFEV